MKHIIYIFIIFTSVNVFSKEKLTDNEISIISKNLEDSLNISEYVSKGSLVDDEQYIAVSYSVKKGSHIHSSDEYEVLKRCAILKLDNYGVTVIGKTGTFVIYDPMHEGIECKIKNNIIILTHWFSGSQSTKVTESWKFKKYNKLQLIGYDNFTNEYPINDNLYTETASSVNFLTKEVFHWKKKGSIVKNWDENSSWEKPFNIIKVVKGKEYRFKFDAINTILFDDFTEDKFSKSISLIPNILGYVNDSYLFVNGKK